MASGRVALRDVKALANLLGELHELPQTPTVLQQHLLVSLCHILRAKASCVCTADYSGPSQQFHVLHWAEAG